MRVFHLDMWLKDKSLKIVNSEGFPVRIVCHDRKGCSCPVIYLVDRGHAEYYGICDDEGCSYSGDPCIFFTD